MADRIILSAAIRTSMVWDGIMKIFKIKISGHLIMEAWLQFQLLFGLSIYVLQTVKGVYLFFGPICLNIITDHYRKNE